MNEVIIDLREQEDYELAHIEGSINIPSEYGMEVDVYLQQQNASEKTIYLICYSGLRSGKTFNYLCQKGYKKLVYVAIGYGGC